MDKTEFWRLIEESKREAEGDCDSQAQFLQTLLSHLPPAEIIAFDQVFDELSAASYRWDLWGAACLINGGASDDGFEYFRRWLIGQGKAIYEGALADPDGLANLPDEAIEWGDAYLECEEIGYAAMQAYEDKTGQEFVGTRQAYSSNEPLGERWKDEDLDKLFPRIAAKLQRGEAEDG